MGRDTGHANSDHELRYAHAIVGSTARPRNTVGNSVRSRTCGARASTALIGREWCADDIVSEVRACIAASTRQSFGAQAGVDGRAPELASTGFKRAASGASR